MDANRWLSVDDKEALKTKEEALREQKYGSRRNKAFTFDIAGRKVVEEKKFIGKVKGGLLFLRSILCIIIIFFF